MKVIRLDIDYDLNMGRLDDSALNALLQLTTRLPTSAVERVGLDVRQEVDSGTVQWQSQHLANLDMDSWEFDYEWVETTLERLLDVGATRTRIVLNIMCNSDAQALLLKAGWDRGDDMPRLVVVDVA